VSILYITIPLALLLAAAGVWAFVWAASSGQYDDVDTPATRAIFDDEN
jgi:cbb3-type cytochrome oxidase maturation protein